MYLLHVNLILLNSTIATSLGVVNEEAGMCSTIVSIENAVPKGQAIRGESSKRDTGFNNDQNVDIC